MGRVVYGNQMSLDGYVADRDGRFDWAMPGEDVHAAVNDDVRNVGTFVLGRRVWEVLRAWDVMDVADQPGPVRDFAEIWAAADKVVCSRTLEEDDLADAARTRISRTFDPDVVRALAGATDRDVAVGGPELASEALASGIVDEVSMFVYPVVVGGGTAAFSSPTQLDLELVEHRTYAGGVVGLRYRPRR
jgi:dihydrofolate reductase